MSQLKNRFVRDLEIRNYSPQTIRSYTYAIERMSKHYDCCPSQISADQIKEFLHKLQQDGKSWSTINMTMSACNLLYTDTLQQIEKVQKLKRPRLIRKLPVVLSVEEVALLLEAIKNLKHKAIVATLYSSGMRVGELISLKINDIDSKRGRISIRDPKGNRDREVPLSNKLIVLLRQYYRAYRPQEYLFNGQSKSKEISPYSCSSVRNILKRNLKKAGIDKNISSHTMRHSYATHLLNKGIDVRIIQRLLGHKSVKTTMIYCHLASDQFDKTGSPLDDIAIW